jgi:hypothetical protein
MTLNDQFTNYTVVSHNFRHVDVFLDTNRLQDGRDFQADFMTALCRTSVVVLIVSTDALQRMCEVRVVEDGNSRKLVHFDPSAADNLLLEWTLALLFLHNLGATSIQRVYPLFFGTRGYDLNSHPHDTIGNFWSEDILSRISVKVPTATLAVAAGMLREKGLERLVTPEFHQQTVKDIIGKLLKLKGFEAWKDDRGNPRTTVVADAAAQVMAILTDVTVQADSDAVELRPAISTSPQTKGSIQNVINNSSIANTPNGKDLGEAWKILNDPESTNAEGKVALAALLSDLGVREASDLDMLEPQDILDIANHLRRVPKKKFTVIMSR